MVEAADITKDHRRGVDHIGVSVSFILHDGNGNVMLHKRGARARDEQGRWDVGGGALEFGESIDDAIRHELKEEFCVEPLDMQFLTAYEAHREQNGIPTHWIALLHAVKIDPALEKMESHTRSKKSVGLQVQTFLPHSIHSFLKGIKLL